MEWQQIIGFYHVVRFGSFTKAAEVTFRTQPALSQQIKALEEELECQLFERIGKRKLRLTPAGEKFLEFSHALLDNYERLLAELNELKGLPKGRLRLAAPFTTLYHLFPQTLKDYLALFPQVELTILDRSQDRVIDLVKNGDIDLGLALESVVPKNLTTIRWKKVETVLITPPAHPLTRAKRVTMRQIAKYPLILPPKSLRYSGRRIVEQHLQKLGIDYHIIMESSNVELSSVYVEMGLGISFATVVRDLERLQARKLAVIPLNQYFKPDYLAVIMRTDKLLPPFMKAFVKLLLGE